MITLSKVISFVNTQKGKLGSFLNHVFQLLRLVVTFYHFSNFLFLECKSSNFAQSIVLLSLIFKFFFFQVKWKKSDVKFEDRFDKYLDPSFFQHRVGKLCT